MHKKKTYIFLLVLISAVMILSSCGMSEERAREVFLQAIEKANEGDFKAAIAILEENIRRADRGFTFYFYRGLFTQHQNFEMFTRSAMEDFYRAYRIEPNVSEVIWLIGLGYHLMGEYERAIPFLERAYELFTPESKELSVYSMLATAYFHVGRLEDALKMNARSMETKGDHWDYFHRGMILSGITGDINDLIENYEIAREIAPDNLWLQRDFALRLIRMGYIEKAYQLYTEWLVGQEDFFDFCYADMAYIHMLKGNWDRSIELLETALRLNNTQVLTLQYASFYHFFTGNYNEAFVYESRSRLMTEPSGRTYWVNSVEEFMENYRNNWQFQKLLQLHQR